MLLTLFFFTIITSLIITNALEKKFSRHSLFIDKPNDRSAHSNPIPTAGGIAMLVTYTLYVIALHNIFVANSTVIFFFICIIVTYSNRLYYR
jgi:UDP-N-acetylmuramyl pentapeptide phosphotransferase/UDP-N-acetylglucosamine-1-phosphate transferase